LAVQTALANESEELRKQLDENEAETENLENTIQTLNGSLSDAKSEIKALSNKLAAARSADNSSRVPGSAMKTGGLANRTAQAEAAHAAQATALAKERLYADLTDLILRGVKQEEMEDTFDCIQTGRNGSKFGLTLSQLVILY
jgi:predicted nuclease with TOPRIM domain